MQAPLKAGHTFWPFRRIVGSYGVFCPSGSMIQHEGPLFFGAFFSLEAREPGSQLFLLFNFAMFESDFEGEGTLGIGGARLVVLMLRVEIPSAPDWFFRNAISLFRNFNLFELENADPMPDLCC